MNQAVPILLTREELHLLTGTSQPKRMADWLEARSWIFEPATRRGDIPKVSRTYYLERMSGRKPGAERRTGPNLDWMLNPS